MLIKYLNYIVGMSFLFFFRWHHDDSKNFISASQFINFIYAILKFSTDLFGEKTNGLRKCLVVFCGQFLL